MSWGGGVCRVEFLSNRKRTERYGCTGPNFILVIDNACFYTVQGTGALPTGEEGGVTAGHYPRMERGGSGKIQPCNRKDGEV